jgi:predicted nucleotidyltransferase
MFALSSYSPEFEGGVRSGLNSEFGSNAQFEGLLVDLVLSGQGSFVRFQWADWPADLRLRLAARLSQFHDDHSYLHPVNAGSPEWNTIFGGSVADNEAADKIAQILRKHLVSRVAWVRSERDLKGKIKAWVGLKGGGSIDFCLSWKDYSVGGIGSADINALRAAIDEVHEWAASRIQPILDTLKAKLQELYGDRFRGLYVFGSYARPDAGIKLPIDSDLDVAVVLTDFEDRFVERDRVSDVVADLSLTNDIVISLIPIREADYNEGRTNFTRVISEYAVPVR